MQPCPEHHGEIRVHVAEAKEAATAPPMTVLISVDGSSETEKAVAWALRNFPNENIAFHCVHVYDWAVVGAGQTPAVEAFAHTSLRKSVEDAARAVLHKVAKQFHQVGRKEALKHNMGLRGTVQYVIPEYVKTHKIDLVVLGSRGAAGVKKWVSSVSNSLLHDVSCNVALIKSTVELRDEGAPRQVVLAIDGSAHSRKAYDWAKTHVLQRNDQVTLVMAFKEHSSDAAEFTGPICEEVTKITEHDCHLLMLPGDPRQVIPDALTKIGGVDLLVMGSRGRGSVASLLLGSVVDYCVGHVSAPLLVVK